MKPLILAVVAALAGCASSPKYDTNSQAYLDCKFRSQAGIDKSLGPLGQAIQERDLIDLCMRSKGY